MANFQNASQFFLPLILPPDIGVDAQTYYNNLGINIIVENNGQNGISFIVPETSKNVYSMVEGSISFLEAPQLLPNGEIAENSILLETKITVFRDIENFSSDEVHPMNFIIYNNINKTSFRNQIENYINTGIIAINSVLVSTYFQNNPPDDNNKPELEHYIDGIMIGINTINIESGKKIGEIINNSGEFKLNLNFALGRKENIKASKIAPINFLKNFIPILNTYSGNGVDFLEHPIISQISNIETNIERLSLNVVGTMRMFIRELRDSYKWGFTIKVPYDDADFYSRGTLNEDGSLQEGGIKIGNHFYNLISVINNNSLSSICISGKALNYSYVPILNFYKLTFSGIEGFYIKCLNEDDIEKLIAFIKGNEDGSNDYIYGIPDMNEKVTLDNIEYTRYKIADDIEALRKKIYELGKYNDLTLKQKFLLDLPLIEWKKGWYYTSIFSYSWLIPDNLKDVTYIDENGVSVTEKCLKIIGQEYKDTLMSYNFFKNRYDNFVNNISWNDIYTTNDLKVNILNNLVLNELKNNLSVGETKFITLPNEFSLGFLINWFAVKSLSVFDYATENIIPDDFAGSWGSVGIRFYFTGTLRKTNIYYGEIEIDKIYFRLNDSFDFDDNEVSFLDDPETYLKNKIYSTQPLGCWHGNVFHSTGVIDLKYASKGEDVENESFVLNNEVYRELREYLTDENTNDLTNNNFVDYRPITEFLEINNFFDKIEIHWFEDLWYIID